MYEEVLIGRNKQEESWRENTKGRANNTNKKRKSREVVGGNTPG